jgi:hypothetical protein
VATSFGWLGGQDQLCQPVLALALLILLALALHEATDGKQGDCIALHNSLALASNNLALALALLILLAHALRLRSNAVASVSAGQVISIFCVNQCLLTHPRNTCAEQFNKHWSHNTAVWYSTPATATWRIGTACTLALQLLLQQQQQPACCAFPLTSALACSVCMALCSTSVSSTSTLQGQQRGRVKITMNMNNNTCAELSADVTEHAAQH